MDFAFTEDQQGIRDALRQLVADLVTDDSLKALDRAGEDLHTRVWGALAESGMLGLAIPEEDGGAGLGLVELCSLLQELGRTVAPVPAIPTLVSVGLALVAFGSEAQRQRYLPGVARGELFLTAALSSYGSQDPLRPTARAERVGDGYAVTGVFTNVEHLGRSARVLVPARTDEGVVLLLVDPRAAGVSAAAQVGTNGQPLSELTLSGVGVAADDVLATEARGVEALAFVVDRTVLALCALEHGICQRAVEMTAAYATDRKQFGVPIGAFQAVSQRVADAYIDVQAIEVAMWQAAWRLDTGRDAAAELAVAKFWASEAGARVVAAAQHVHGGMGFDRDYPLYRYFLGSKHVEFQLGGAEAQLAKLGDLLAAD